MAATKSLTVIAHALLKPNAIYSSVDDIRMENLYSEGYRTLFLDVDNTILPYDKLKVSLQKQQWVDHVKSCGFEVVLISNNISFRRIQRVAQQLGVQGLVFAGKPFVYSLKEWINDRGIEAKTSIVLGDKLFTDVVLGNWLKMYTILVDPLDKRVSLSKTLMRDFEMWVLGLLDKKVVDPY